ncbi:hypothetical protein [Streptomyces sp. NPDC057695]|uniref:hypothetical protein n=1 Tax=unclassified Streptomyces TaxID=2593676 RepID=UPI0036385F1B
METRPRGKQHLAAIEERQDIARVNAYLEALERGEETEVPLEQILQSMTKLLRGRGNEVMVKIRHAERDVWRLRNSTDSVHENRVLSARFRELSKMETQLNQWMRRCLTVEGVADFEEMRRELSHKEKIFSLKITELTRPLDIPD